MPRTMRSRASEPAEVTWRKEGMKGGRERGKDGQRGEAGEWEEGRQSKRKEGRRKKEIRKVLFI